MRAITELGRGRGVATLFGFCTPTVRVDPSRFTSTERQTVRARPPPETHDLIL